MAFPFFRNGTGRRKDDGNAQNGKIFIIGILLHITFCFEKRY
jgi:hypothetical protein